jgi:hypothetical protein
MVIRFCTQFDFDFVELHFATVLHLPHIRQLAEVIDFHFVGSALGAEADIHIF